MIPKNDTGIPDKIMLGSKEKPRDSARPSRTRRRRRQEIAEPAHGLDDVDLELLANAPDEHLDGVGVAVEILVVEMLDELGARHHAADVMHQVFEQIVLVRGQLDRVAADADAL